MIVRIICDVRSDSIFWFDGHGVIPTAGFRLFFRNRDQRRRAGIHVLSNLCFFSDDQIQTGFQIRSGRDAFAVCRLARIRRELLCLHPSGECIGSFLPVLCLGQVVDISTAVFIGRQQGKPAVCGDLCDTIHRKRCAENRLLAIEILNREASGLFGLDGFACESVCCQNEHCQ